MTGLDAEKNTRAGTPPHMFLGVIVRAACFWGGAFGGAATRTAAHEGPARGNAR